MSIGRLRRHLLHHGLGQGLHRVLRHGRPLPLHQLRARAGPDRGEEAKVSCVVLCLVSIISIILVLLLR